MKKPYGIRAFIQGHIYAGPGADPQESFDDEQTHRNLESGSRGCLIFSLSHTRMKNYVCCCCLFPSNSSTSFSRWALKIVRLELGMLIPVQPDSFIKRWRGVGRRLCLFYTPGFDAIFFAF